MCRDDRGAEYLKPVETSLEVGCQVERWTDVVKRHYL
jgi:hypothetical protein